MAVAKPKCIKSVLIAFERPRIRFLYCGYQSSPCKCPLSHKWCLVVRISSAPSSVGGDLHSSEGVRSLTRYISWHGKRRVLARLIVDRYERRVSIIDVEDRSGIMTGSFSYVLN